MPSCQRNDGSVPPGFASTGYAEGTVGRLGRLSGLTRTASFHRPSAFRPPPWLSVTEAHPGPIVS